MILLNLVEDCSVGTRYISLWHLSSIRETNANKKHHSEERQPSPRSTLLLYYQLIATPLSAVLMPTSPWIPVLIGLGISYLGLYLAVLAPETLSTGNQKRRF